MQPIIDKKFIAYGGPGEQYLVDVVGTVATVGVDAPHDWLWIVPDPPYEHLALAGNRRWPKEPGEGGHEFYVAHIQGNGYGGRPILKCETYAVGGNLGPGGVGHAYLFENGVSRPVRPHDHVRIRGLYVLDYSHQPWSDLHTESFSYARGVKKAGYAHAELHPWAWHELQLSDPAVLAQPRVTIVAPYNDEIYTWTHFANFGDKGHLIEESHKRTRTARFTLGPTTSRPSHEHALTVIQKDVMSFGDGGVSAFSVGTGADGLSAEVHITVEGNDLHNPFVHTATYEPVWEYRPSPPMSTVPHVLGLLRLQAKQQVEAAGFTASVSGRGRICDHQDPPGGTSVPRGSQVLIVCPGSTGGGTGGGTGKPPVHPVHPR